MSNLPDCLMSPRELAELGALARRRRVLEMGAWRGRTTAHLALEAQVVWTIDHHRGDADTGAADTLEEYFRHLNDRQVEGSVVSIVADFLQVLPHLKYQLFDLVLVDGAHDRASVRRDLGLAVPLVRRGGYLCLHDFDQETVNKTAVDVLSPPLRIVDTLAVYQQPVFA